jgi:large subunit ribosomal protein L29
MARRRETVDKFRNLSPTELENSQRELTEQVFRLRFQLNTGQAEALKKLRESRRDLARVKTILRQKELKESNGN